MKLVAIVSFASLAALAALAACHSPAHHADTTAALTEAAIAVPIRAGRTDAWKAALADLTGPRYDEYRTSRARFGLTSQTTFVQRTPMGDFALIHLTGADVRASFHAMSTSQDPWDVSWRKLTEDLHGVDFATAAPPSVELAYETGPDVAGPAFMFVAPIDRDRVDDLRALAAELTGDRHAAYAAARARAGIAREAVFLEEAAMGDAIVVFWRCADPRAAIAAMRASRDPMDRELADAAARLHPLPLDQLAATIAGNELVGQFPR